MRDIIEKKRKDIKKLAEEFNFNYDSETFKAVIITKKDFVKLIYLVGCPAEPYSLFGKTIKARVKKYYEFILSNEFSKEIKRPSGTVIEKEYSKKVMEKIKDEKMKVQASIQGEQVRVTGKKRDDLQQVITMLKEAGMGIPLQFQNFRD